VRGPSRPARRGEITAATTSVLRSGDAGRADLLVVDLGEGPMVVKDFATKSWWGRVLGRLLTAREIRAYRWLGDSRDVPRLIGRIDAHALALEKIDGVILSPAVRHRDAGGALASRIRALADRMHARGFAHLDLNRRNLLRCADDQVVALDLAGAVWFRPGSFAHRLFFRPFATADDSACLKWKDRLAPGTFDADEETRFRRLRFLRNLWPFNRKPPKTAQDS